MRFVFGASLGYGPLVGGLYVETLIDWDVCCTGSASSRRRFFEGFCGAAVEIVEVSRTYGGPDDWLSVSEGSIL
jgi:hypothetical protein